MQRAAGRRQLTWMGGVLATTLVVAACGGSGGTQAPVTTATAAPTATPRPEGSAAASDSAAGTVDCSLLSAADLTAAGIAGAGTPSDNADGSGHYCVYAGTSGATGGIEFDVFPNASVSDAQATYQTVIGEGPPGQPATGPFDESSYATADKVAYLAVRKGPLVFALSAPDGPATQAALLGLAVLVIQRAGAAAGS